MAGASVSRNILAVLLVITIIVSLMGTLTAIMFVTSQGGYGKVPEAAPPDNVGSGKVSVYLSPLPAEMTGKVTANLVSVENGG